MPEEKIDKIARIEENDASVEGLHELEHPTERVPANKEQFNALMQEKKEPEIQGVAKDASKTSLMETVRDLNYNDTKKGPTTSASLASQTQEAITQIEEAKKILESPNVNVRRSAQQLLNSKLSHIDENLKVALSKAGIEYDLTTEGVNPKPADRTNPIGRFLSLLTDGQWKLEQLGSELETMGRSGQELSPVNMLAIQVKMGQIQQELELFTSLLSKGLESIKTIMNIQV